MKTKHKIIIIFVALLVSTIFLPGCIENNTATYQVTFTATWSEETHPDDFPTNPHFSGLIGASHNSYVSFWSEGELASPGIKSMAENGSKSPLNIEIGKAYLELKAYRYLSGEGVNTSPGSVSMNLMVSKNYPLVTLVCMLAPSPDWFVGIDSLNLLEDGEFVNETTIVLYAYDAGTDSGTNYTSPDDPTDPPVPIYKIEEYPFYYNETVVPVGTFTFTKVSNVNIE